MSTNHFSSDLPETNWGAYHHHHHNMEPPSSANSPSSKPNTAAFWGNSQPCRPIAAANPQNSSSLNLDLNNDNEDEVIIEDERENEHTIIKVVPNKEPLFEKPLTPSDVGKLNRLVIPKQHAEKYFPLSGNDSGGEKGLLLSFEDESGKPWRFRYSYWNSSQSYVLTKGWSRFVKEKRLDAGDIVLFERHRLDGDRLFIGWRRRGTAAAGAAQGQESGVAQPQQEPATVVGGGGGWTRVYFPPGHHPYPPSHHHHHGPALPYQPHCLHAAAAILENQTTALTSANSKRLRLFGVNLECQQQPDEYFESSSEPPTPPEGSSTWIQGQGQADYHFQYYDYPKDVNFSRDVNQTRHRHG